MKKIYLSPILLLISIIAQAQLTNGLVAHWNFNGTVADATNNGHHGTAFNITYTNGINGQANTAAVFDGSTSYVITPYNNDLNFNTYSIAAVVKINKFYQGTCQGNYIVGRDAWPSLYGYSLIFYDNAYNSCSTSDTDKYVFAANAGDASPRYDREWQHSPNIHTQQWYHVVATYNGVEYKIYLNCKLVNIIPVYTGSMRSSVAPLSIGYNLQGGNSWPYWFNGLIEDLRLYNRVLSASEINQYCEIDLNFISGNNDTALLNKDINIINRSIDNNITVYPNPNNGNFTIRGNTNSSNKVQILIINTLGQAIYSDEVLPKNNIINKTVNINRELAAGVYILQLKTETDITTTRFRVN